MFGRNMNLKENCDPGYLSDSTLTASSGDLLCKRRYQGKTKRLSELDIRKATPLKSLHTARKFTKTVTSNRIDRKRSLVQCLEKQSIFKRKPQQHLKDILSLSPIAKNRKKPKECVIPKLTDSDFDGSGDHNRRELQRNQVNVHPAFVQKHCTSEQRHFPFRTTPSGNYKLKPSQVVYESKNLSIVAADPENIMLNVTESCKNMEPAESMKKTNYEDWATTCLYTAVGSESKIPFGSEFSDTISESDGGLLTAGMSHAKPSEISLAKMGYVKDNNFDWKHLSLPKKSELQKMLLQNILNMVNTDIEIKIGDKVYKCHKLVLQCYCSYFTSKSSSQLELPETSVSKEAFSVMYQWMLDLGVESYQLLRRDNILDILKAAQFLGNKELEDQCWAFIDNMEIFSEDNAFLMYVEARENDNKTIMEMMVPRVQSFFLTLVSSKEFVELSCEEVGIFLRSNYICIHCEMEVFMAGVRWIMHDWEERKEHISEVMKCVRFGFINPKVLITLKRNPQSPEFLRIANTPEVSKMIDDGVAFSILKTYLGNETDEEIEKVLKNQGLTNPTPRNWAGKDKNYQSYQEFLKDLAHYRSKQRLEIRRSKMEIEFGKVDDEEFLSSAVFPPATHQKIQKLHGAPGSLLRRLPELDPKELDMLKKIICNDEMTSVKRKKVNARLRSVPEGEYKFKTHEKHRPLLDKSGKKVSKRSTPATPEEQDAAARKIQTAYKGYTGKRSKSIDITPKDIPAGLEEQDAAARKIQTAYRGYTGKKSKSIDITPKDTPVGLEEQDAAARKIQTAYRGYTGSKYKSIGPTPKNIKEPTMKQGMVWRSRSDPSLPSGLLKSNSNTSVKYEEHNLPLQLGNETVFIFGGTNPFDENNSSGQMIRLYRAETNSWNKCGELPEPRHFHSVLYFQGKIYVAGGKNPMKIMFEPGVISRKVWKFDPDYKAWTRIKDMLQARRSFGFVVCYNKMFAIGGSDGKKILDSVEKYDEDSKCWVVMKSMNVARVGLAACEFNDRIWVAGGMAPGMHELPTTGVEYYNYHQNMWIQITSLRYTLAYSVMVPIRDKLYLVGGAIGLDGNESSGSGKQIDVWNHDSQAWCLAAMLRKPRHAHAAVYVRSGQLFVMGGMSAKHQCVIDSVECWQDRGNSWVMGIAPIPEAATGLAALSLPADIMT